MYNELREQLTSKMKNWVEKATKRIYNKGLILEFKSRVIEKMNNSKTFLRISVIFQIC